jgi:hypothetical protein
MLHYIKIAASNESLRSDYREVYKNVQWLIHKLIKD